MDRPGWETRLSLLSLCGQLASWLLGLLLARHLGVEGFEAYAVAATLFVAMVMVAPQGLEKYAPRLLPPLVDSGRHDLVHGYLRFSRRRTLWGCLLVGVPVAVFALSAGGLSMQARVAILATCLSLPAGALVHLWLEILTATGRATAAAVVFRLVPAVALLIVAALLAGVPGMQASWAIGAWGMAWCIALLLMARDLRRTLPVATVARPVEEPAPWSRGARPFWLYRVSLAVLAQGGVLALELLQAPASAVGAFVAALATAGVAQVLATSTNRVYASRLSLLVERGDIEGIQRLRVQRRRWLVVPLALYLAVVFGFAPRLVGLFHPAFVAEGANALRILAVGTAIGTVFAMAPTWLKHQGENRALLRTVAASAALQVLLLAVLVPRLGTTGAALAHMAAGGFMYLALAHRAHRGLRQMRGRRSG